MSRSMPRKPINASECERERSKQGEEILPCEAQVELDEPKCEAEPWYDVHSIQERPRGDRDDINVDMNMLCC